VALAMVSLVGVQDAEARTPPRHTADATAATPAIRDIPLVASQNPSNLDLPFSQAVWAGDTLYVSGWLDPDIKTHPDTKSQTVGIFQDVQKFLATQKLTLGDVAMIHEYLQEGKAELLQARAGYIQFFGTKEQPHKPANTAIFVDLPASARGGLIEIDMVVVRPR
jgi:enamine deaminase RidA (YjgF/YER057c/UK114 family)